MGKKFILLSSYFIACLVICACWLIFVQIQRNSNDFCSTEGTIYQIVAENGENWMASLPDWYSRTDVYSGRFTISGDDRVYYAESYGEIPGGKPLLVYVITGTTFGGLDQGSGGYIYLPSGELTSRYWLDNYRIKRMNEHIYCYKYPSLGDF